MSVEKKSIIEEIGFDALAHILELNISHKLLRELIRCFDAYHGCLDTLYGKIYITPAKIRDALGIGVRFPDYSTKNLVLPESPHFPYSYPSKCTGSSK